MDNSRGFSDPITAARNRVWLAIGVCSIVVSGIAVIAIAYSTRERQQATANASKGDASAKPSAVASTENEALERARHTAASLLPTLTEYRAEESLVRHFDSNAANAEQALELSQEILHRGGKKPPILDVLREPDKAFFDLEISPEEAIADQLQTCRDDIDATANLIDQQRTSIEQQQTQLTKARESIEVERKELEASFKKFPAMLEPQKQQQRDRLESRASSITGPIDNAIASLQKEVSQLERRLADLKRKEPELSADVAKSVERHAEIYFQEINRVVPILQAAGLPSERDQHVSKRNSLYETLLKELREAATRMRDVVGQSAPPFPSRDGLVIVYGVTHIVQGDRYYVENKVVTIPPKYKSLYVTETGSPNEVAFHDGWFRFTGNTTGTNGFGAAINVEQYECDTDYSESLLRYWEYESGPLSVMECFDPLPDDADTDDIESIIEVLRRLLGEESVSAALDAGDRKFDDALTCRKPFTPLAPPTTIGSAEAGGNSKPVATDDLRQEPVGDSAAKAERPLARNASGSSRGQFSNDDVSSSQPPEQAVIPVPKENLRLIHRIRDSTPDKGGSLMRWYSGSEQETKRLISADSKWEYRDRLGYGLVRQEAGTKPLWRYTRNRERQVVGYFVGEPQRQIEKKEDLVAYVWTEPEPGMIPVHLLQTTWGPMQLEADLKQRDWLAKHAGWKSIGVFYLYPPEPQPDGK